LPAVGLGGFYPPPPGPRQLFCCSAGILSTPQLPPGHRLPRPPLDQPDRPDDCPDPARPLPPPPRAAAPPPHPRQVPPPASHPFGPAAHELSSSSSLAPTAPTPRGRSCCHNVSQQQLPHHGHDSSDWVASASARPCNPAASSSTDPDESSSQP